MAASVHRARTIVICRLAKCWVAWAALDAAAAGGVDPGGGAEGGVVRLWTIGLRPASFDGNALPCLLRDVRVKMGILILLPAIAEGSWCVSGRSLLPIGWLHARRFETQVFKVPARW
jgi:hypothetical protein